MGGTLPGPLSYPFLYSAFTEVETDHFVDVAFAGGGIPDHIGVVVDVVVHEAIVEGDVGVARRRGSGRDA